MQQDTADAVTPPVHTHTSLHRIPEPSAMLSHWPKLQRPLPRGATQNTPQLLPQAVPICTNTTPPPAYRFTVSASHLSAGQPTAQTGP